MCGKKELFSQLDESIWGDVNFGNKSKVSIIGKGNVKIRSKDGTDVTIANVFFASNLFWNLLSMGQLTENGISLISLIEFAPLVIKIRRWLQKYRWHRTRFSYVSLNINFI